MKVPKLNSETYEERRSKFPKRLINVFVKLVKSNFSDDVYEKYKIQEEKYLGDKVNDRIEQGKLIVLLTKATIDLCKIKKYRKKE